MIADRSWATKRITSPIPKAGRDSSVVFPYTQLAERNISSVGGGNSYLGLCVRPRGQDNAHSQHYDRKNLNARVSLPPQIPSRHGGDTPARPKNDVNRDRYIVAEGVVVEYIDAEEEHNVDEPPADGYFVRGQEEWRP